MGRKVYITCSVFVRVGKLDRLGVADMERVNLS